MAAELYEGVCTDLPPQRKRTRPARPAVSRRKRRLPGYPGGGVYARPMLKRPFENGWQRAVSSMFRRQNEKARWARLFSGAGRLRGRLARTTCSGGSSLRCDGGSSVEVRFSDFDGLLRGLLNRFVRGVRSVQCRLQCSDSRFRTGRAFFATLSTSAHLLVLFRIALRRPSRTRLASTMRFHTGDGRTTAPFPRPAATGWLCSAISSCASFTDSRRCAFSWPSASVDFTTCRLSSIS